MKLMDDISVSDIDRVTASEKRLTMSVEPDDIPRLRYHIHGRRLGA